jgi:heme exporter protein D
MDWNKFFSMGGYAFYVWGSYLVTAVVLGGEVLMVMKRKNALRRQQSELRKN